MILATILAITILFADIIIFADVAHHSMRMKPPTEMILCYLLPIKIASKLTVPFEMPKGQVLKTAMFLVSWMINVSPEIFNSHVGSKSLCEFTTATTEKCIEKHLFNEKSTEEGGKSHLQGCMCTTNVIISLLQDQFS